MNALDINKIYSGCGFVHALVRRVKLPKVKGEPKEDHLNEVVKLIKIHEAITRVDLGKVVSISRPTLDNCLKFLFEAGEIIKKSKKGITPFADRTYSATDDARLVY